MTSTIFLLLLVLPLTLTEIVKFGMKLVEFGGYQDQIIFGLVDITTKHEAVILKQCMKQCLEDYLKSELRQEENHPVTKMTGKIESIEFPILKGDSIKYRLSGDVKNLYCINIS